jgi:vitamin B12 transporter
MPTRFRLAATAALLLWGFAASPIAAQEAPAADTFHLKELVVTATGAATPRALLPQAVSVLDGADLRARGVQFLSQALVEVPGIQVVRTGSLGATTSVFMRGGNSNFVKVLLDGVPLNEPGGRFDFGSFSLENIERVEVVRGPSSVLYGSDAVAGVVHLFTREGSEGAEAAHVSAALRGGSGGSWSLEGGARGATERAQWSLSLGRSEADGTHDVNNRFRSLVGSGRVAFRPDDVSRIALALRIQESTYHFPTDGSGVVSDLNQFTFDDGVTLSLEAARALTPALEGRILLRLAQAERGFENAPDSPADTTGFAFEEERLGNATRRGADVRLAWTRGAARVTGGVDWEVERERLHARAVSNFGGGASVSASSFAQDRWSVAGYGQLEATGPAGVRFNAGARADRNEVFGSFLTGQLGVVAPLGALGRLRARLGSAFKAPTFSQQFAATPFERGNEALEPETSRSIEGGWDAGLLDDRVVLGVGVFRQSYRNLVEYENRGDGLPTYFNEARARSTGVETSASWRGEGGIQVGLEHAWIDARAVSEAGDNPRLLRRPAHRGAARFRSPLPGAPAGASWGVVVSHVGSRVDNDFSTFPATRVTLDAYTTADLDVQLPVSVGRGAGQGGAPLLLTFRVENLADAGYTSVVGFPGLGRRVLVGARWNP